MRVPKHLRQPIAEMLFLLKKPGDFIYVGLKNRRYVWIYMQRHFAKIGYKFEYAQMKVRGITNKDKLEEAHIFEIYRKS